MTEKKLILLIDDDARLLFALAYRLKIEGYEVLTATNGETGLTLLREHAPNLIVLDINMPGMSGIKFLRSISNPDGATHVPVIIHTARMGMEEYFASIKIEGFVAKADSPEVLLKAIAHITGSGRARLILIGDDERSYAGHLSHELRAIGFETIVVESGPEVVTTAVQKRPDLILAKMILPGMNGAMVAETLHAVLLDRMVPVVLYDDSGMPHAHHEMKHVTKFLETGETAPIVEAVRSALIV